MLFPDLLISNLKSNYRSSTIKVYEGVIRRLYREAWGVSEWDSSLLLDHEGLREHLSQKAPKDAVRILVIVRTLLETLDRSKYESPIHIYRNMVKESTW